MSLAQKSEATPSSTQPVLGVAKAPVILSQEYFLLFRKPAEVQTAVGAIATGYVECRREAIEQDHEAKKGLTRAQLKDYDEFDRSPTAMRRKLATGIFSKLGMLRGAVEADFESAYTKTESDITNGQSDIATVRKTMAAYFEHPALSIARLIVGESSLQFSQDDSITMQRTMAQLLESTGAQPHPMNED